MRAGKLRERINIQNFTIVKQANGEEFRTWVLFQSVWCEPRALTERSHSTEKHDAGQVNAAVSFDFECRGLVDVTSEMRVSFEGRLFDIEAVIPVGLLGRTTLLHCRERQDNGNDY